MNVVSDQRSVVRGLRRHGRLNAVLARRGISLLEILVSIFILSIGILGVAALIPIGKLALIETNKSDRTGACGRASLREIKTRRMTDTSTMGDPVTTPPAGPVSTPSTRAGLGGVTLNVLEGPFAVDPLGVSSSYNLTMNLGGPTPYGPLFPLPRLSFAGILPLATADTAAQRQQKRTLTEQVFRWQDDLTFDRVSGSSARPRGFVQDSTGRVGPYPSLPSEPVLTAPLTPISTTDGLFSWFFTVMPDLQRPRTYYVSVVVCYRRNLRQDTSVATPVPEGEQVVDVAMSTVSTTYPGGAAAFPGGGFGGGTVILRTPLDTNLSRPINKLKDNQWVMLCGWTVDGANNRIPCCCQWYRVVGVNRADAKPDSPVSMVSLTGPDWTPADINCPANPDNPAASPKIGTSLVVVDGVTGVYSTTVQLDNDAIWNK
ncbi:MAG: hypothetical protein LLG00_07500 [Planctomycetaceae bacterium]|nr:hypothetical protein [Planctomycetaceae bacterium]